MSSWGEGALGYYRGRRVLLTGHTGFKGSWLSVWLKELGAEVLGYSKDIPSVPSAFELLGLDSELEHVVGDIRDREHLSRTLERFRPECVFHLAAQPLVRASYRDPLETFSTNVLGTASVFEALRSYSTRNSAQRTLALVNVTSDKCYENRGWEFGYRETDAFGGSDPYSASKGCAEIVFASYARSFFEKSGIRAASARAGNVIGGGDYAEDRLIPDCIRAWSRGERVVLRNPGAIRPWQHVLEPLSGYLLLGARLGASRLDSAGASAPVPSDLAGQGFNFGPTFEAFQPVARVVQSLERHFPGASTEILPAAAQALEPHEARTLKLSIDKAAEVLGWRPTLSFPESIEWTASWYRAALTDPSKLAELTRAQITNFTERQNRASP
jgi:CDP-glucose 4,6-dehydratase